MTTTGYLKCFLSEKRFLHFWLSQRFLCSSDWSQRSLFLIALNFHLMDLEKRNVSFSVTKQLYLFSFCLGIGESQISWSSEDPILSLFDWCRLLCFPFIWRDQLNIRSWVVLDQLMREQDFDVLARLSLLFDCIHDVRHLSTHLSIHSPWHQRFPASCLWLSLVYAGLLLLRFYWSLAAS